MKVAAMKRITINGISYKVNEQLSLLDRGRWKIWDHRPADRGTSYTLIDLKDTPAARQLLSNVQRLPHHQMGLPKLRDFEIQAGYLRMIVDYCHGMDLQTYMDRFKPGGKNLPIGCQVSIYLTAIFSFCLAVT